MAYLRAARAAASSARAQETLDHPLIGRYLQADAAASSIAPYELSPKASALLSHAGIPLDPHPTLNHAHPACKTLENYFLSVVIPPRLNQPTTAYYTKAHKARQLANACRQPIVHAPTALTAADLARYPDASTHAPAVCTTPLAYIDEALQFMTPLDVATLFDRSPDLHTAFALVIAPPEVLTRSPSAWPSIYQLDYHGEDLVFTPDEDYDGAYIQPVATTSFWLTTRRILGPRDVLTVTRLDSRFGHHLLMITRRPCEAPTHCTYGTPDMVLLPDVLRPAPATHDRAIPRKLAGLISLFVRSVRTLTEAQLMTRIRSYVADGRFDVRETALLNACTVYLAIHRAGPISPAHTHTYNAPFAFLAYALLPRAAEAALSLPDFLRAVAHLRSTTCTELRRPTPLSDHHLTIEDRHSLALSGACTPASYLSLARAAAALASGQPNLATPADPNAPPAILPLDAGGATDPSRGPDSSYARPAVAAVAVTTIALLAADAALDPLARCVSLVPSAGIGLSAALSGGRSPRQMLAAVAQRAAPLARRLAAAAAAVIPPPRARRIGVAMLTVAAVDVAARRCSPLIYRPISTRVRRALRRHVVAPVAAPLTRLAELCTPIAVRSALLRLRVLRNPRLQYDPVMADRPGPARIEPPPPPAAPAAPAAPPEPAPPAATPPASPPPAAPPPSRTATRRAIAPPPPDPAPTAHLVTAHAHHSVPPRVARPGPPKPPRSPPPPPPSPHRTTSPAPVAQLAPAADLAAWCPASPTPSSPATTPNSDTDTDPDPLSPTPPQPPRPEPAPAGPGPATTPKSRANEVNHAAEVAADALAALRACLASPAGAAELAAQRWPPPGTPRSWPSDWHAAQLMAVLQPDTTRLVTFNVPTAGLAEQLPPGRLEIMDISALRRPPPPDAANCTAVNLDPLRDNLARHVALTASDHIVIRSTSPAHSRRGLELSHMAHIACRLAPGARCTLLVPGPSPDVSRLVGGLRLAGATVRARKLLVHAPLASAHVVDVVALPATFTPTAQPDTAYELFSHDLTTRALGCSRAPDLAADEQLRVLRANPPPLHSHDPADAGGALPPLPTRNDCLLVALSTAAPLPRTSVWTALLNAVSPLRRHQLLTTAPEMTTDDLAAVATELRLQVQVHPTGAWLSPSKLFGPADARLVHIHHRPGHWFVPPQTTTVSLPGGRNDIHSLLAKAAGGLRPYRFSAPRARPYLRALRNTDCPLGTLRHRHSEFLESLASKLKHLESTAPRPVDLGGVMGLPGSSKSRALVEAAARYVRSSAYSPGTVTFVAPRETLMRAIEHHLQPPANVVDVVHTFEMALIRPAGRTVVMDDAGLLPPGYTDLFIAAHPETRTIIFTGDTLQGTFTCRYPELGLSRMAPEIKHLSHWANSYRMYTDRLAVGVARTLGLPTTSTTTGEIRLTSRSRPHLPTITARTLQAQTLSELAVEAYTGGTSQGLTFHTAYQIVVDEDFALMAPETLFTMLTRGTSDVYLVCLPARRSSFLGRNALLDALLTEDGLAHQVDLLIAANVPQHLLALDRGGSDAFPSDKLLSLPHLHGTIPDHPRPTAPEPTPAAPEQPTETRTALVLHPITHTALAREVLDALPPREFRELYCARLACLTEQFPEELDATALFPVHKTKDAATVELTFAKRVRLRATTLPPDITAAEHRLGHELFVALIAALGTPATECTQERLDACRAENDDAHLAKPLQELINNARRSEPSWPRAKLELSMKNQAVTKLEALAGPAKAGQTIACFRAEDVLEFGPYGRHMLQHTQAHLPTNVHIHCRASTEQLQTWVASNWDFAKDSTEDDCVALDQSLRGEFLVCEALFMAHHGIPDDVIKAYMIKKLAAFCFLGLLELIRFSGEWGTFLFNSTAVIAHKHLKYRVPPGTPQLYAGDDSAINAVLEVRPSWARLAPFFLLRTKPHVRRQPVFCGWRLTPAGLIKDPKLSYYRLLFALARSAADDGLRSYFIEHLHTLRAGAPLLDHLEPDLLDYVSATNALFAAAAARRPRLAAALKDLKRIHLSNSVPLPDKPLRKWTTSPTSTPHSPTSTPTTSRRPASSPPTTNAAPSTYASATTRKASAATPAGAPRSRPRPPSTRPSPRSSGPSPRTAPASSSPPTTSTPASTTTSRPTSPPPRTVEPTASPPPPSPPARTSRPGPSAASSTRHSPKPTPRSASGPAATPRPCSAAPAPPATSSASASVTASQPTSATSASTSPTASTPRTFAATSNASSAAPARMACSTPRREPPTSATPSPSSPARRRRPRRRTAPARPAPSF